AVADVLTSAILRVIRRRHAERGRRTLIDAARRAIARFEGGAGDAAAALQATAQALHPQGVIVLPRAHAQHALELALQMPGADSRMVAEFLQADRAVGLFLGAAFDIGGGFAHGADDLLGHGFRFPLANSHGRYLGP